MECVQCGGVERHEADGFWVCSGCDMQLGALIEVETVQSESFQLSQAMSQAIKQKKIQPHVVKQEYVWTLYEGFTQVLKQLSNDLIKLGAHKRISSYVLYLWSKLLDNNKVSLQTYRHHFTSTTNITMDVSSPEDVGAGDEDTVAGEEFAEDENVDGSEETKTDVSVRCISMNSLISILHLAIINMNDGDIYLCDMLRWMREDSLRFLSAISLLPKEWKFDKVLYSKLSKPAFTPCNNTCVRVATCKLAAYLGVGINPRVKLKRLIRRLGKELMLPSELIRCAVNLLNILYKKPDNYKSHNHIFFEGIAFAHIIITLKILFGLDGASEDLLSKYAVNYRHSTNQPAFVWKEWVDYILVRRHVVRQHHLPFSLEDTVNDLYPNPGELLGFLERSPYMWAVKPDCNSEGKETEVGKERYKSFVTTPIDILLKHLSLSSEHSSKTQVPITSFAHTYTEVLAQLKDEKKVEVDMLPRLDKDFSAATIDWLINADAAAQPTGEGWRRKKGELESH